jgi:hypothetical protein
LAVNFFLSSATSRNEQEGHGETVGAATKRRTFPTPPPN